MKIIALSDIHGILPEIKEEADLLIIAGDISPFIFQSSEHEMEYWLYNTFKKWVLFLPVYKVILIAGNHDFIFKKWSKNDKKEWQDSMFDKLIYLENESCELEIYNRKLKIFGTPYCHKFGSWPFMLEDQQLKEKFQKIPENLDIFITHDPVYNLGKSDIILEPIYENQKHYNHIGSKELSKKLLSLKNRPKYVLCGHIHSGEHKLELHDRMNVANVALMGERCDSLEYEPLVFEI